MAQAANEGFCAQRPFLLFIDTASDFCTSAIFQNNGALYARCERLDKSHSERLAPQLQELCAAYDFKLTQLAQIFVNIGPGSFTGIRIGVSFAKALSLGLNIKAYGINSLEVLALKGFAAFKGQENSARNELAGLICAIKAYNDHYYIQAFSQDKRKTLCAINSAGLINKGELTSYAAALRQDLTMQQQNTPLALIIKDDSLPPAAAQTLGEGAPHFSDREGYPCLYVQDLGLQDFIHRIIRKIEYKESQEQALPLYIRPAL